MILITRQRRCLILKVTGKLVFIILVIAVGIAFLYLTTSAQQRSSGLSYSQGWLAYKFKSYEKAAKHFGKSFERDRNNLMALYFAALSKVKNAENSKRLGGDQHLFREAV